MDRRNWTREESILALALYCKIPFAKISKTNKQVIQAANLIGRTPSAVSMKMGNFGYFDSELKAKGISGLIHVSHLDEEIWNEFYQNMELLFSEAEKIAGASELLLPKENIDIPIGEEKTANVKVRKGQAFFRNTILSAYDNTCCITGINIPKLLQASHIKSWNESDPITERTNPVNGLCLNSLHHSAFDAGFITIDTNYKIIISKFAKDNYTNKAFDDYFLKYEGMQIKLPDRFMPSKAFIIYHNSKLSNMY